MNRGESDTVVEKNRRTFFTQAAAGLGLLALAPGIRLIDLAVGKNDEKAVTGAVRQQPIDELLRLGRSRLDRLDRHRVQRAKFRRGK